MIPAGGRVLVALSGGPDSVALTLLLKELEDRGPFQVAGVAHVNHAIREEAKRDQAFSRELAATLGIPYFTERVDVRKVARQQRRSVEDAGRTVRYAFFRRVMVETGIDVVATGHSRNDQAETFLLRLMRGAGARGLAGIYPVAGRVVRPLLDVRREELREYLETRGQDYCEDSTNLDLSIPRNRIRHELIPYLERAFTPGIIEVFAREADAARADAEHLQKEAIESSSLIVLRSSSNDTVPLRPEQVMGPEGGWFGPATPRLSADIAAVEIDAAGLAGLSQAVASRVVRLALSILAPDRFVGFDHVAAVLSLAAARGGGVSLPGQQAVRRGVRIELVREPFRGFTNSFQFPLSIPGEVLLEPQGWAISAEPGSGLDPCAGGAQPPSQTGPRLSVPLSIDRDSSLVTVAVRADSLVPPLGVRARRPGDRFQPPGLEGRHKKLQDFLVDRKVPVETRDSLPLVVDGKDRIVWIVGLAVGEDFRVTGPSQGVILLKARRLGGPG
jgi:tRNA(Ile)-lysidine synthase